MILLRTSLVVFGCIALAACSSSPTATGRASVEHSRASGSALSDSGEAIVGAYQAVHVVSGVAVWRQLNLVADGTFNGFTFCKVPVCAQIRTFGTWEVDDESQTLTLTPKGGEPQSFAVTTGWDDDDGLEISDGTNDVQLAYVAATCTAASDSDGQTVLGADQTCGDGSSLQTACTANVCEASCVASTPPPPPTVAQRGAHCGGFVVDPPACDDGLVCVLGFIPDVGGTCEPQGTPTSCAATADCLDGQTCVHRNDACDGAGRCVTLPAGSATACP